MSIMSTKYTNVLIKLFENEDFKTFQDYFISLLDSFISINIDRRIAENDMDNYKALYYKSFFNDIEQVNIECFYKLIKILILDYLIYYSLYKSLFYNVTNFQEIEKSILNEKTMNIYNITSTICQNTIDNYDFFLVDSFKAVIFQNSNLITQNNRNIKIFINALLQEVIDYKLFIEDCKKKIGVDIYYSIILTYL